MKVAIVTFPCWGNYGGMVQGFALKSAIDKLGFNGYFLTPYRSKNRSNAFVSAIKRIKYYIKMISAIMHSKYEDFILRHSQYSCIIRFRNFAFKDEISIYENTLGEMISFVVGSDQVWRLSCTKMFKPQSYFFLPYASKSVRMRSISYAASFGIDEWEGDRDLTTQCQNLLRDFKAVSVREFSGVRICKEVFDVDAIQMPDPTLLANLEDYERAITSEKTRVPKSPYFASYVLDDSAEASQLLDEVEKSTGLYHQRLLPKSTARKRYDRFYCTVAQWLRYLRDCDAVVTDSFHGCVFSIIYNKPFVCLGNVGRGSARFDTLFQVFGLEDRLVTSREPEEVLRVLHRPVDWQRVNAIHEAERLRGLHFLKCNLNNEPRVDS